MNQEKYIGMDVRTVPPSSIAAWMDAASAIGSMECLLGTSRRPRLPFEFIRGLHGTLSLTFEEGTSAAWLHDLLKLHVSRLVVCDPRKNALLKDAQIKSALDRRAAGWQSCYAVATNSIHVYHGEHVGSHFERTGAQLSDHHPVLPPAAEKAYEMDNKPNTFRDNEIQWAGSRETISLLRSEAELLFLDIPLEESSLTSRCWL